MIPITPKMMAQAYRQTAGATHQSAARRFWMNRFRTGGPRVPAQGLNVAAPEDDPNNSFNVTGPSGIDWDNETPSEHQTIGRVSRQ